MRKVELVRCVVSTPAEPDATTVRYVPLEIFHLWKYLMKSRHDFHVADERTAIWIDVEAYEAGQAGKGEKRAFPVVEVRFRYADGNGPARQVVRYFPAEEFQAVKKYMLGHFAEDKRAGSVTETPGFFLSDGAGAGDPSPDSGS